MHPCRATASIAGVVRLLDNIDSNKYAEATRLLLEKDTNMAPATVVRYGDVPLLAIEDVNCCV